MNLVRDNPSAVVVDDRAKLGQLLRGAGAAERVVRVAQREHAGTRARSFFDALEVHLLFVPDSAHRDGHLTAGHLAELEKWG